MEAAEVKSNLETEVSVEKNRNSDGNEAQLNQTPNPQIVANCNEKSRSSPHFISNSYKNLSVSIFRRYITFSYETKFSFLIFVAICPLYSKLPRISF